MRLKKNVQMNSLVERLKQLQQEAGTLAAHFTQAVALFNDTKFGINEINFNIDEDVMRFNSTYGKIEELIKGL